MKKNFLKLKSITEANHILFWLSAYCGKEGNELADLTAKKSTKIQHDKSLKIPYTDLTLLFKKRHFSNTNRAIEAVGEIKLTEYCEYYVTTKLINK